MEFHKKNGNKKYYNRALEEYIRDTCEFALKNNCEGAEKRTIDKILNIANGVKCMATTHNAINNLTTLIFTFMVFAIGNDCRCISSIACEKNRNNKKFDYSNWCIHIRFVIKNAFLKKR